MFTQVFFYKTIGLTYNEVLDAIIFWWTIPLLAAAVAHRRQVKNLNNFLQLTYLSITCHTSPPPSYITL
jgi:hypothetical protein